MKSYSEMLACAQKYINKDEGALFWHEADKKLNKKKAQGEPG